MTLLVGLGRGLNQIGPDIALELLPHRRHRLAPGSDVVLAERLNLRLAGFGDALLVALVEFLRVV